MPRVSTHAQGARLNMAGAEGKTSESGCDIAALWPEVGRGERILDCRRIALSEGSECIVLAGCLPYQSRFLLGHRFGVYPTPGGWRSSCFRFAALRVTVSISATTSG